MTAKLEKRMEGCAFGFIYCIDANCSLSCGSLFLFKKTSVCLDRFMNVKRNKRPEGCIVSCM